MQQYPDFYAGGVQFESRKDAMQRSHTSNSIISLPSTRFSILNLFQVTLRYTLSLSFAPRTR